MNAAILTVAAVFTTGFVLSVPLGYLTRVPLIENRYAQIDGMRAIAAMMVVCSHYIVYAKMILGDGATGQLNLAFGAVGVQIFFCITAFLFTRKAMSGPIDVRELLQSRVRRILPLFVFAMTASIMTAAYISTSLKAAPPLHLYQIASAYTYGFFGADAPMIKGVSTSGQIGQAWSLHIEWLFYLFVPFLAAILSRRTWLIFAMALALLFAVCVMQNLEQAWPFFLPGILAAVLVDRVKLGKASRIAAFGIGVAAFLLSLLGGLIPYRIDQFMLCLIGFPCLLFGTRWFLSLRPLRLLGEVSYSIYLLHLLVASGFLIITTKDFPGRFATPKSQIWLGLVMIAGLYLLSFATYALVERPFIRTKAVSKLQKDLPAPSGGQGPLTGKADKQAELSTATDLHAHT